MPEAASRTVATSTPNLEDRYGTGERRRFDRRFAWILGGSLLVIGLLFILWNNWQNTNRVEITPISSSPVSDFEFEAKFSVSAPLGSNVACAVEVLSSSKATVGWKVVEVPFHETRTRAVAAQVRTTTPGTAAHANSCWVVEG